MLVPGRWRAEAARSPQLLGEHLFALLTNNQLLALSLQGRVVASRSLSHDPALPWGVGDFLAFSPDRTILYALVPEKGGDHIAIIDAATLNMRASYALEASVRFESLVVGSRSGRLYVAGSTPLRGSCAPSPCTSAAVVDVLDPATAHLVTSWVAHPAQSRAWLVYQAAVSSDERSLFLSYHGPNTTGLDVFTIEDAHLRRCTPSPAMARRPDSSCLLIHGRFAQFGDGFIATTGDGPIISIDRNGVVHRRWNMRLTGNHLMDFALDSNARWLYSVGSCGYTGGLSSVNLSSEKVRLLVKPYRPQSLADMHRSGVVCGEWIVSASRQLLVIAKNPLPVLVGASADVLFVDSRTGAIRHQLHVPAETLDIVVGP